MMYQLCDGFSVNTGWFTINVHIGGLFHSVKEIFDSKKHHVTFKFHMLKAMRKLTSLIEITINGHIEETAYISEYNDMEDSEGSNHFEPGHVCEILGRRIKIEGPAEETGLWMVPVLDPSKSVKVNRVVSNNASRIEFIPVATGYPENRLEIRTRYSGTSATPLATLRSSPSQAEDPPASKRRILLLQAEDRPVSKRKGLLEISGGSSCCKRKVLRRSINPC